MQTPTEGMNKRSEKRKEEELTKKKNKITKYPICVLSIAVWKSQKRGMN